jgi:hypothetical protein
MEWADAQIWKAVLEKASLSMDGDLRERLYHFHCAQWAFGQVLCGRPLAIPDLASLPDMRSICLWARQFYGEIAIDLVRLDELELGQTVKLPWTVEVAKRFGSAAPAIVRECLLQLVLHTTHHRGQVMLRLREAAIVPPVTDFIAWVWMGRPAADWGSLEAG